MHQNRHSILVLFVYAIRIEQDKNVQRLLVVVLGCKHSGSQALTILDLYLVFWLGLVKDQGQNLLVLSSNGEEDRRAVLLLVRAIMESQSTIIQQIFNTVLLII